MSLRAPVPVRAADRDDVVIVDRALLGLTYRQEALLRPQAGYKFINVLSPRRVFHAQVAMDELQPLCLGAKLPAGILVKELILLSYNAISMQTIQIDVLDPAGVMCQDAALYWQANGQRIPLSKTPYLRAD